MVRHRGVAFTPSKPAPVSVILGINAYHPGASAALVVDGVPVVTIAEERLNRIKHYGGFPTRAIRCCLEIAGLGFRDVDAVAVGRDRSANLLKKAEYALRHGPGLRNLMKIRASGKRIDDARSLIARDCDIDPDHLRCAEYHVEHHLAHTASAYFVSEWTHAAGISIDGSGDFVTCMMSECEGDEIRVKRRLYVPHSLGFLYTAVCQFIGYPKYGDEGKVMALAALGEDVYRRVFDNMIALREDGLELNPTYFLAFEAGEGLQVTETGELAVGRQYADRLVSVLGSPRLPGDEVTARDRNVACGLQRVFEAAYLHLLRLLHGMVPTDRLVMAGGCTLNSVANGKVPDQTPFRQTSIQPAAGDEGLALGAALYVSNAIRREGRRWVMRDAFLGPAFSDEAVRSELERRGVAYEFCERPRLVENTAQELASGRVVGWFQGRMEWGPRALGNRSILAHPGLPHMKDVLNARVKHRESFRPFAPSVLAERQGALFEHSQPSPFMQHVYPIKPEWRARLSAVTHVDGSGRLQTVSREANPLFYELIRAFERKTGIGAVLNTSFNDDEPIVCTPAEALDCFLRTSTDVLVMGPFICRKAAVDG